MTPNELQKEEMDFIEPPMKRNKKKDKAREKHERNGTFSAKHVRLSEAKQEKATATKKGKSKK
jgi:hypothetical protein